MKCSNSSFNAQGSRVIIVVVQVGAVKIHVAAVEALGKGKDGMKLSLPPKFMGKLVWVPIMLKLAILAPYFVSKCPRSWMLAK